MEIRFKEEYLETMYRERRSADKKHRFQPNIVIRYCQTIDQLEAVNGLEDLYRFNSLHFETLHGDKEGRYSVRVNDKYRIEFTATQVVTETVVTVCLIEELSNHYK